MLKWEYGEPVDDGNLFLEALLAWCWVLMVRDDRIRARKAKRIRRALARRRPITTPKIRAQITKVYGTIP